MLAKTVGINCKQQCSQDGALGHTICYLQRAQGDAPSLQTLGSVIIKWIKKPSDQLSDFSDGVEMT